MENIDKLIKIIDNYLIENKKSFIGLKTANELIKNSDDQGIRDIDLKKTLENGLIPNSSIVQAKKRYWRIYLSAPNEETRKKSKVQIKTLSQNEKSINSVTVMQQKNGKALLIAIGVILLITYFVLIKPDRNSTVDLSTKSINSKSENNEIESNSTTSNNNYITSAYVINTNTYGTTSKEAMSDMFLYLSNNDREAFATAMMNGEIIEIPAGTNVYVKENHFAYTIIKIAGFTADIYIPTEHLTKK